jgi:hypothetical protein
MNRPCHGQHPGDCPDNPSRRWKLLWGHKDGGQDSNVRCWGVEIKGAFSILLLHFAPGSREAFHSHAFNAVSWLLWGSLYERVRMVDMPEDYAESWWHLPGWRVIRTWRGTFHKVSGGSLGAWVLTLRGRWHPTWKDGQPGAPDTLTHGRRKV